MNNKIAFIIQARLGSTRLPNKIILPFYNDESIIRLLIHKLKRFEECRVILATSVDERNLPLVEIAKEEKIEFFRGSENDVIKRFVDTAESFGVEHIIRICSDNPLLDMESLQQLLDVVRSVDNIDYVSFNVNNTPSIKTHFGFWAEYVTLEALRRVIEYTDEKLYHEHVTNYIYSHPELFRIKWIDVPQCLQGRHDIRLTIDTENDFKNVQKIYETLYGSDKKNSSIASVVEYIDSHSECLSIMKQEIINNTK